MGRMIKVYLQTSLLGRILFGFILGTTLGIGIWLWGNESTLRAVDFVSPLGTILIHMLKMIVIPVIFFSLVTGAAQLSLKSFGRVGTKVIGWYLMTSLIAAVVGTAIALLINPGRQVDLNSWQALADKAEAPVPTPQLPQSVGASLTQILLNLFQNPFAALAGNNFLAVIVFALLFGLALRSLLDRKTGMEAEGFQTILTLMGTARDVVFKIVDWILEYSPIGICALTLTNFSRYGKEIIGPYLGITLGVITGVMVMMTVVYPLLLGLSVRQSPYKVLRRMNEALLTAFITRSSAATLPVTFKTLENRLGVKREITSFSLPLGATINMDGVCIHLPVFAVLAANIFGVHLNAENLLILVMTTVLASIGAGGVPGGSLMLLFVILQPLGLKPEQVDLIIAVAVGINPILDMFETANNVTGDMVCSYVVACKEGLVVSQN